jgi:2-hydroxycyclohexanecarboxyl-CoA dehydrogenase
MTNLAQGERLAGRVALITGGGAGIGAETARLFCSQGAQVLIVDRDAAALQRQLDQARGPKGQLSVLHGDAADPTVAQQAVDAVLQRHGRLDILVNNAARRNHAAVAQASAQDWRDVLDVNLVAAAQFCRLALPALRASGDGSIINVSSCYAVSGRKGMAIYDASKAALQALTRTLAHEEAVHNVRANAVCPGATLTEFQLDMARTNGIALPDLLGARKDASLLGRWAQPTEVAWPILWLASREASYITGSVLMVDGGRSAM